MKNHPANRRANIDAMEKAGCDPGIGKWPGDPGYVDPDPKPDPIKPEPTDGDGVAD